METSSFLLLSAELRNLVYWHTFSSKYSVEFGKVDIQHPLTRTSKQIRYESLAMYYALTRFNAHLRDGPVTPLIHWIHTIGREAFLLVREIRLWDMHDNVLTILSPAAAERHLMETEDGNVLRSLPTQCSLPEDNALAPIHREQLWQAIAALKLGLRQFREQYSGSSIILSTSSYALTELGWGWRIIIITLFYTLLEHLSF